MPLEKRSRNVAHLWADKRIMRFFRKNFNKTQYKNLRLVYLALCEIESDFVEKTSEIIAFTKTVACYAGVSPRVTSRCLQALQKIGLLDYHQDHDSGGKFKHTSFILYEWADADIGQKIQECLQALQTLPESETPYGRNHRMGENAITAKTPPFKNAKANKKNKNAKASELATESVEDDQSCNSKNSPPCPYEEIKDLYHSICKSLPGIKLLSENRKKAIKARWNQYRYQINEFEILFHKAEESNFLKGKNDRNWTASFDWLLKDANMAKTLEGRYDNKSNTGHFSNTTNGNRGLAPQKLIKEYFPEPILRQAFIKTCYKPAKTLLGLQEGGTAPTLVQYLLQLHSQIARAQNKLSNELKLLLPDPIALIERYLIWIKQSTWIQTMQVKMFDIEDGRFARFRREEATKDNLDRDPITGKSYMRG